MLRAGKSIEINQDILNSEKGVIFAPIINLSGLVIRADREIPEPIQQFLSSHGAQVHRIRFKNELHILLKGTFRLNKAEIEAFIKEHGDLVNALKEDLEHVPVASQFQSDISAQLSQFFVIKEYHIGDVSISSNVFSPISAEELIRIRTKETKLTCKLASGDSISISATKAFMRGIHKGGIGLFSTSIAQRNFSLESQDSTLENTLIDAGENISLTAQSTELPSIKTLKLSSQINWLNNPHPELHPFEKQPSTEELLAQADELLFRVRTGV
jgi:hypothetical protein